MRIKPVESDAEWQAARAIRERVFIEEQDCPPEEEWDGYDATSRHLLGFVEGEAVAAARWRSVAHEGEIVAKLERFAVLPAYRGRGCGRALVRYAVADARRAGFTACYLHAQVHLKRFYASLGFRAGGERFIEAGIPHVAMIRREERTNRGAAESTSR